MSPTNESAAQSPCCLSGDALIERRAVTAPLIQAATQIEELADGHALRFEYAAPRSAELLAFVEFERQCCAPVRFELDFEPNGGGVWLRARGDAAAKAFLGGLIHAARQPFETPTPDEAPVLVIGAGPVGLAAAAHLLAKGAEPLVIEGGPTVGAAVREWGHVRLFSPWRECIDAAAADLLARYGWQAPNPEWLPTGDDVYQHYLKPLAETPELRSRLRLNTRVVAVTRLGFDKLKTSGRDAAPFLVQTIDANGGESSVLARAVIDATGTWRQPNPISASGVHAVGETALADRIAYGIPDVLGAERARYAGKRVMVVGSGHSAFNALLDLAQLKAEVPATTIVWSIRRQVDAAMFGGGGADALAARGLLGTNTRHLVETGVVTLLDGFRVAELAATPTGIVVSGDRLGARYAAPPVDEIIGATGFRPDLNLTRELRLSLDPMVECPTELAPLIDPNVHSCGSVRPHGAVELGHPDSNYYIVGMKSYGRAPTFLMLTGYEQVRSVACALIGDWAGARRVELVLPETGVCSGGILPPGAVDRGAAACCGPTPASALTLSPAGANGDCCLASDARPAVTPLAASVAANDANGASSCGGGAARETVELAGARR